MRREFFISFSLSINISWRVCLIVEYCCSYTFHFISRFNSSLIFTFRFDYCVEILLIPFEIDILKLLRLVYGLFFCNSIAFMMKCYLAISKTYFVLTVNQYFLSFFKMCLNVVNGDDNLCNHHLPKLQSAGVIYDRYGM
jgi:hypothetical protein